MQKHQDKYIKISQKIQTIVLNVSTSQMFEALITHFVSSYDFFSLGTPKYIKIELRLNMF